MAPCGSPASSRAIAARSTLTASRLPSRSATRSSRSSAELAAGVERSATSSAASSPSLSSAAPHSSPSSSSSRSGLNPAQTNASSSPALSTAVPAAARASAGGSGCSSIADGADCSMAARTATVASMSEIRTPADFAARRSSSNRIVSQRLSAAGIAADSAGAVAGAAATWSHIPDIGTAQWGRRGRSAEGPASYCDVLESGEHGHPSKSPILSCSKGRGACLAQTLAARSS